MQSANVLQSSFRLVPNSLQSSSFPTQTGATYSSSKQQRPNIHKGPCTLASLHWTHYSEQDHQIQSTIEGNSTTRPMSPQINRRVSGRPQSTGEKDEAHILEGTKRERPNISLKRVPEGGQRSEGRHSGSMSQESPTKDRGARNDRYDGAEAYGQDHSGSYSKSGIHSWVLLVYSNLREG